ncbi:hypothetical protein ACWKSP_12975 [Micromonosporaceae bacterium Da 78-11]
MTDPWATAVEVLRQGALPPIPHRAGAAPVAVAATWRGDVGAVVVVERTGDGGFQTCDVLTSRDADGSWRYPDSSGGAGDAESDDPGTWFVRRGYPFEDTRSYALLNLPGRAEPVEICCVQMRCPSDVTRVRATDDWGTYDVEVSPLGLALLPSPVGSRLDMIFLGADGPLHRPWSLTVEDSELDALGIFERQRRGLR